MTVVNYPIIHFSLSSTPDSFPHCLILSLSFLFLSPPSCRDRFVLFCFVLFLPDLNEQQNKTKGFGFDESSDRPNALLSEENLDVELTLEQKQQLEEMDRTATDREKEIIRIAKSIHDLSTLFSELNVLVIEQGTILDRIDYNIEQTLVSTKKGVKELEGAEEYSRKALTCKCIVFLCVIVAILIGVLAYKKSGKSSSNSDNNNNNNNGGNNGGNGGTGGTGGHN